LEGEIGQPDPNRGVLPAGTATAFPLTALVGSERVRFFPTGGHLGNLHRPTLQAEVMASLDDLAAAGGVTRSRIIIGVWGPRTMRANPRATVMSKKPAAPRRKSSFIGDHLDQWDRRYLRRRPAQAPSPR
jgi:hypothetical protein